MNLVRCAGDNMLTALSVARECGMVDRTDKIILVQAYEPSANCTVPEIEFFYTDDRDKKVEEVNVGINCCLPHPHLQTLKYVFFFFFFCFYFNL